MSAPLLPSGKCTNETVRKRSNEIKAVREMLSMGDSKVQLGNEMKMLPKNERESLMKDAQFTVTIPPEEGLAMKATLNIPWHKLRIMRR